MVDESNAYATVIADLKRKRKEIDEMIARLEAFQSGAPVKAGPAQSEDDTGGNAAQPGGDTDNPYLGMSIPEAAKALLGKQRKMMRTADIVERLEAGGLVLSGSNKTNTVGSILNRRQKQVGDVVSPKRGCWGLKEWYPGRNFGKKPTDNGSDENREDVSGTSEPAPPSEPPRIVPLHSSE